MSLPRIILIDDNKDRSQQFCAVIQFLGYEIDHLNMLMFSQQLEQMDDVMVIFIGSGLNREATAIRFIIKQSKIPVVLLVEKGMTLKVSSTVLNMVQSLQEWPVNYSVLTECLNCFLPDAGRTKVKTAKTLSGSSQQVKKIDLLVEQVAVSEAAVLIYGESGTGKELVARAIHKKSLRAHKPFVPINCGAISAPLLESELFGHEKGAFSGALTTRKGRFELAEGGTLFLDEISDMPLDMQLKLLRVLEEKTYQRVGSEVIKHCDVRIISATHHRLEASIKNNVFREDLFYRLNVFPIDIPPLRERSEDVPFLIKDIVTRLEKTKRGSVSLSAEAVNSLTKYLWPGNVRELANLIERLAIMSGNGDIEVQDLPDKFLSSVDDDSVSHESNKDLKELFADTRLKIKANAPIQLANLPSLDGGIDLKDYLTRVEIKLIEQALIECNWVVAHAANLLGIRRTTLVEKIKKFGL